jgi:hypothetical protein
MTRQEELKQIDDYIKKYGVTLCKPYLGPDTSQEILDPRDHPELYHFLGNDGYQKVQQET